MKRTYLANAFSLNMLPDREVNIIKVREIDTEETREILKQGYISAIGHVSTAEILTEILEMKVESNRASIKLEPGDMLIVFQLLERLPEGVILTKEQILNLKHKFFLVSVTETEENYSFEL